MSLSRQEIVAAAFDELDAVGLDELSMRGVARRLGVQHNTVYWHMKSRSQLLELMADAVVARVDLRDLPASWIERVRVLSTRLRAAVGGQRDGARLLAGIVNNGPHTFRYADLLLATFFEADFDAGTALKLHWSIFYLMIGVTQEEQAPASPTSLDEPLATGGEYPALARVTATLMQRSFSDQFEFGLDLILDGARRLLTEEPTGPVTGRVRQQ